MTFFKIPHVIGEAKACLVSAFRTALACTIVGCLTLFGPTSIQNLIAFPAFSYVAVILIINDATLGDTFRGCWLALYATIQSIGPAIFSLWLIGPGRFSLGTTTLVVALATLVVALPSESTHLVAKRIALGQIVIVYFGTYINGVHTEPIMHPLRVAASTAVGVFACVISLLLPFPRLACYEVKRSCKLLTRNTLKRVKLLTKAICEEDKNLAVAYISHAHSLATTRTKLLQIITRYQDGMRWENPLMKLFGSYCLCPKERLEEVDTYLRGMELALRKINSFPVSILDENIKHGLNNLEQHVSLTIKQTKHNLHGCSITVPEPSTKTVSNFLQSLHTFPTTHQCLPVYFYLFCSKLLYKTSWAEGPTSVQYQPTQKKENSLQGKEKLANWVRTLISPKLMPAIKCSLSLGLALFSGSLYSRNNGFWSALPVAISFASGREATFRVANVKAQGTVLGTVYGVLGCFVFERFLPIRFMSLLPWFIFTSFLQRSKMYGPAGGISAVIGAILILGRKNFGQPSEFAIVRIIETFIGLTCSIVVDLLFMPKRASSCAKVELCKSLVTLDESIRSFSLLHVGAKTNLEENQKKLKMQVEKIRKFVLEAEAEPNFWLTSFHSVCYNKLLRSLSIMVDILHLGSHALEFLHQEFQISEASREEYDIILDSDLPRLNDHICSSIKSYGEICRMKSLKFLEKELEKKNITYDIEMGGTPKSSICMVSSLGEDEIAKYTSSYLQHSKNVVDNLYGVEGEEELRNQVVLSLSALGFCMSAFIQQTLEIEEAIKELIQWENPSREINLYDISCKLATLYK
ncbi:PREDICTED: uncharacterized protein LOC109351602 [Lupinus angustifolius]|uniref:uncharacterized protein LOC109351602 n=1 Tax=Lupinus angustifolius TaxID=3871 RepID=UPI00092EE0B9|nr:PREDICTED: uncharacterized protein LOC109351602 [Lupinus angustifolius]